MKKPSLAVMVGLVGLVIAALGLPTRGRAENPPDACRRKLVDQVWLCSRSLGDLRSLAICVQAYVIDNKRLPKPSTPEELKALFEPMYIKTCSLADAWGTPLRYVVSPDGTSYRVISAGSDPKFDPASWD